MKGCWLALAAGIIGLTGCTGTPKREMRQEAVEEFSAPPPRLDRPPDYAGESRLLTPKTPMPFNMNGVSQPGSAGVPGGSPAGSGMRR